MSSKRATLELVDVENAPPQEGIAFTNQYVSKYHEKKRVNCPIVLKEALWAYIEST